MIGWWFYKIKISWRRKDIFFVHKNKIIYVKINENMEKKFFIEKKIRFKNADYIIRLYSILSHLSWMLFINLQGTVSAKFSLYVAELNLRRRN